MTLFQDTFSKYFSIYELDMLEEQLLVIEKGGFKCKKQRKGIAIAKSESDYYVTETVFLPSEFS